MGAVRVVHLAVLLLGVVVVPVGGEEAEEEALAAGSVTTVDGSAKDPQRRVPFAALRDY